MKKAKILLLGIILILASIPELQAMLEDNSNNFGYQTWGGSYISCTDNRTTINHSSKEIKEASKWYFYKKNIVGTYQYGYFILNENTGSADFFGNKEDWYFALKNQKLHPKIYTRWYKYHIGDSSLWGGFSYFILVLAFVCLPAVLLVILPLVFGIYKLLKQVFIVEQINFKKPGTLILSSLILLRMLKIFFCDWFVASF